MDQATITSYGSLLSAVVTAVATIFLWRVTKTLAIETRRMVEAGSQPHVVATIEPSRWSMRHSEITVANTGNATAYNIRIVFNPNIKIDNEDMKNREVPLQDISVLKPGQEMSSYLSEFGPIMEVKFEVEISWLRSPVDTARDINRYSLDMSTLKGTVRLGSADPLVQIAEDIRKIRDDWRAVAHGSRRVSTDVFTQADRDRVHQEHHERWRQVERDEEERLARQTQANQAPQRPAPQRPTPQNGGQQTPSPESQSGPPAAR